LHTYRQQAIIPPFVVRVKARLNLHGVPSFEAVYTEKVAERDMQIDGESSEAPNKKKVVEKNPVTYVPGYGGLDSSVVEKYREKELAMHTNDQLVQDTEVRCLPGCTPPASQCNVKSLAEM